MLKKIIPIILSSTIIITSFSFSAQVKAKNAVKINQNSQKFSKALANLKDKDPQKLISQKLKVHKNNENELISEQSDNLQIKFELQNKKIKVENKK